MDGEAFEDDMQMPPLTDPRAEAALGEFLDWAIEQARAGTLESVSEEEFDAVMNEAVEGLETDILKNTLYQRMIEAANGQLQASNNGNSEDRMENRSKFEQVPMTQLPPEKEGFIRILGHVASMSAEQWPSRPITEGGDRLGKTLAFLKATNPRNDESTISDPSPASS